MTKGILLTIPAFATLLHGSMEQGRSLISSMAMSDPSTNQYMKNSKYIVPVIASDNFYVVRSTYNPFARHQETGEFNGTEYNSFSSEQKALDYASSMVEVGDVTSVEVRHIIRIVHKI